MASNLHNTRLLRFLIVVTIVVLTIFIYASYSSTQTLAPPPMRSPSNAASLVAFPMGGGGSSTSGGGGGGGSIYNNNHSGGSASSSNFIEPSQLDGSAALVLDANNKVLPNKANVNGIHYTNLPPEGAVGVHGNEMVLIKKLPHHRVPTIDENALDDGGDGGTVAAVGAIATGNAGSIANGGGAAGTSGAMGSDDIVGDETALEHFSNNNNDLMQEDQYVQSVDNTLGNINNSVAAAAARGDSLDSVRSQQPGGSADGASASQQQQQQQQDDQIMRINNINNSNLNKIPESDVLIPTSNLQKFIESADKILKNITGGQQQPLANGGAPSSQTVVEAGNKALSKDIPLTLDTADDDNVAADDNDEALPPSVIMAIKGVGSAANNANVKQQQQQPQQAAPASAPGVSAAAKNPPATTKKVTKTPPTDPVQGIPTQQLYEPGHMNEEIDVEQICPNRGDKLKLLILITSAQTHAEARLAIRQTWGHFGSRRDVSTAFILGRTTNATISKALTQENMIYGDLIRGHFIDSYNNLTLKTLSSLEWVDHHCPKTKFVLKTDDDMFINVPKLLQYLDAHAKTKRVIYGRLAKKWKPIRNKKSKYYISPGQFSAAIFPPFTTGPAYVMTSDIVHELYERSLHQVYLKLEDVFTTGIVAEQLGIKRVHANEFLNRRIAFNPCNIRKSISVHMIKANEQFDLWKKLLDQTTKCK